MARSTYIYILLDKYTDAIIGAFTVKHELETFLKRNPQPDRRVRRYRDGYPGQFTETDLAAGQNPCHGCKAAGFGECNGPHL